MTNYTNRLFQLTIAIVAALSLPHPAPAANMIGYWENWGAITLGQVSSNYDIIDLAFAIPGGTHGATVTWSQSVESDSQFRADIQAQQALGKKVILSVGGADAPNVDLQNSTDISNFVSSVEGIVSSYGLNGIDLDLENGSMNLDKDDENFMAPTTPQVVNLITAMSELHSYFGSHFLVTYAPETDDVDSNGQYGTWHGDYLPIIWAYRANPQIVATQCYDSGTQTGRDGNIYSEGTKDFDVALTELLMLGYSLGNDQTFPPLRENQVAFGVPAVSGAADAASYQAPSAILAAAKYIGSGISYGGSYTLEGGYYPNFAGVMTWDIDYDQNNNTALAGTLRPYLSSIGQNPIVDLPFGGTPAAVPGTIQAANYDTGGQQVAYEVTSYNGTANSYRIDGVDLEDTTDTGGGYDLGWSGSGQWFRYTVNTAAAAAYTVSLRMASDASIGSVGGRFHLADAVGTNLSGTIDVPGTGGWEVWTTVNATVTLPAGRQVIVFDQDTGGYNLHDMTFAVAIAPTPPTGLTATADNEEVGLTWTASANSTAYDVFRGTSSHGESDKPISTVTSTSYLSTGLANGTTYYYVVKAVNFTGTSKISNEASATPKLAKPLPPPSLTAMAGTKEIKLSWGTSVSATSYDICRGTVSNDEDPNPISTVKGTSYTNTGLTSGKMYYYVVKAVNSLGTSKNSVQASTKAE